MTKIYTITGQSTTKPSDLPEGFTVEETETEFRRQFSNGPHARQLLIKETTLRGVDFDIEDCGLYIGGVNLDTAQTAKLRDALTEYLDDGEFVGRVFVDEDEDEWHEQSPDAFDLWQSSDGEWSTNYEGYSLSAITRIWSGGFASHRKADKRS
jgi:hypothetical protein